MNLKGNEVVRTEAEIYSDVAKCLQGPAFSGGSFNFWFFPSNGLGLVQAKSRSQNFIQISYMHGRCSNSLTIFYCLSRCINSKLGQKLDLGFELVHIRDAGITGGSFICSITMLALILSGKQFEV